MADQKIWVVLCGGPGLKHPKDKGHDTGWSNYVDHLLLMAGKPKGLPIQTGENIWWIIYEPAYVARWTDDVRRKAKSVSEVRNAGFTSYTDMLKQRAAKYKFKLFWINKSDDFYRTLQKTPAGSISRVWYYGHASDDLWLTLDHDPKGRPIEPSAPGALVRFGAVSHHSSWLKGHVARPPSKYNANRSHRFYGCNSKSFAIAWAKGLAVFTEGAVGTVQFEDVHQTGAPDTSRNCTWERYDTKGKKIR